MYSEEFGKFIASNLDPGLRTDDLIHKFKNNSYTNGVLSVLKNLVYQEVNWEPNPYHIPFTNGVYDLKEKVFRASKPEDYLTANVGYDYNPDACIKEPYRFVWNLFEDQEVVDYVLKILSCMLLGEQKFQCFYIHTGYGRNGKSRLMILVNNTLGDLIDGAFNPNYWMEKSDLSERPSPALHNSRNKKGLLCEEPEEDREVKVCFNSGRIKKYTGGCALTTRTLNKTPSTWQPKADLHIATQKIPNFNDNSHGFKRRLKLIRYPFTFIDDPEKGNERCKIYRKAEDFPILGLGFRASIRYPLHLQ
jgi:putative DNA primase/helicase